MDKKTGNLDDFCVKVKKALISYFKDSYNINIQSVQKTNGVVLQGVTISKMEQNIAPTIYMDEYYEFYQNGRTFSDIMKEIIKVYEDNELNGNFDVNFFCDYEKVKGKLCYKLINYELNQELLKEVPYIRFLDLAVVCFCMILNDTIGSGSILIHNNHLKIWKVSKDTLFEDAKKNMPKIFPMEMKNMTEVIEELFLQGKREESMESPIQLGELQQSSLQMFVLTNKSKLNGASAILYDHVVEDIATLFGKNLYILPSSIHEVILIPQNSEIEETHLSRMVNEVNETQLRADEILSNHAYLYTRANNQITSLPLIPE